MIGTSPAGATRRRLDGTPFELVFEDDPLMAVRLAFDAVLRGVALLGQQPHDRVAPARRAVVAPIRRELHGLADRKLVFGHKPSPESRRRPTARATGRRAVS